MIKEPISISFANQKGGIGKSTLTILAAAFFRYVRGLNVLVVDWIALSTGRSPPEARDDQCRDRRYSN